MTNLRVATYKLQVWNVFPTDIRHIRVPQGKFICPNMQQEHLDFRTKLCLSYDQTARESLLNINYIFISESIIFTTILANRSLRGLQHRTWLISTHLKIWSRTRKWFLAYGTRIFASTSVAGKLYLTLPTIFRAILLYEIAFILLISGGEQ